MSVHRIAGFRLSGIASGIKPNGKPDLALIECEHGATAAGLFTRNRVKAAPVRITAARIRRGSCRAVLVNSGNANACNGAAGRRDALRLTAATARLLCVSRQEVLVCSTGVIGKPLPAARIERSLPRLVAGLRAGGVKRAARAILTTDTRPKIVERRARIGGSEVRVCGFAKGAGMVRPDLATILVFILTDARVSSRLLHTLLQEAARTSFNRISIDGQMSTNDTLLGLASGSGAAVRPRSAGARALGAAFAEVSSRLSSLLVEDGEGVTKLVTVRVVGASSDRQAEIFARAVAESMLVKTALYGEDPNWGRIAQALGAVGAPLDPERIAIAIGSRVVCRRGRGTGAKAERAAHRAMRKGQFAVRVQVGAGRGKAEVLTADLSPAYVRLNAAYRS